MVVARRARRRSGFTTSPDVAKIGPLLREAGFVGSEADPVACIATFDDGGNPRCVSARYEDGWSCRMRLRRDGSYSLTQSFRMVIGGARSC